MDCLFLLNVEPFLETGPWHVLKKNTVLKISETDELTICSGKQLQLLINFPTRKIFISNLSLSGLSFQPLLCTCLKDWIASFCRVSFPCMIARAIKLPISSFTNKLTPHEDFFHLLLSPETFFLVFAFSNPLSVSPPF